MEIVRSGSISDINLRWRRTGILVYVLSLYFIVVYFGPWFDARLFRFVAGQYPLLIASGWLFGYFYVGNILRSDHLGVHLSVLIFFMISLIFWMLPVSVDSAALDQKTYLFLASNLWIAGLLVGSQFRRIRPEIKLSFLFMISSMIFVSGIVLNKINLLLCGSYTLSQQKILSTCLIIEGLFILILSFLYLGTFFRKDDAEGPNKIL